MFIVFPKIVLRYEDVQKMVIALARFQIEDLNFERITIQWWLQIFLPLSS